MKYELTTIEIATMFDEIIYETLRRAISDNPMLLKKLNQMTQEDRIEFLAQLARNIQIEVPEKIAKILSVGGYEVID